MYVAILVFMLGLIIGSFLNVCIYRIPRKEDIVYTPSHCMSCGTRVKWYDLIPVISWMLLGGKCRHCKIKLSKQYPVIELSNGAAYLGVFYIYGLSHYSIMLMVLFSVLLVIGMIDYKDMIIPNALNIFIFITGLVYRVVFNLDPFDMLIGFFCMSTFLFLMGALYKGGMGFGDVKLMAVCGLLLGWKLIIVAVIVGSVIGSIIGLVLIGFKIINKKQMIPFGPFLAVGIFVSGLYGNQFIDMYFSLITG